jgi:hypothetical protein
VLLSFTTHDSLLLVDTEPIDQFGAGVTVQRALTVCYMYGDKLVCERYHITCWERNQ